MGREEDAEEHGTAELARFGVNAALVEEIRQRYEVDPTSVHASWAELFEAEGPTSQAGRALLDRLFLVSRLELIWFAVIVALMTFKPGA